MRPDPSRGELAYVAIRISEIHALPSSRPIIDFPHNLDSLRPQLLLPQVDILSLLDAQGEMRLQVDFIVLGTQSMSRNYSSVQSIIRYRFTSLEEHQSSLGEGKDGESWSRKGRSQTEDVGIEFDRFR